VLLKDWELLEKLNSLFGARGLRSKESVPPEDASLVEEAVARSIALVRERAAELAPLFRFPEVEALAILWPVAPGTTPADDGDEDTDTDDVRLARVSPSHARSDVRERP
jgi:hypothetical protein